MTSLLIYIPPTDLTFEKFQMAISQQCHPIHFMFGSRVDFGGRLVEWNGGMEWFVVLSNPRWR